MPPNKIKPPNIDLTDDDFTCILTAAIRYTLGRETYMPMLVTDYIRPLLPYLSDKALWYKFCIEGGEWVDNPYYDPNAPEYDGEWKNWNFKKIWTVGNGGLGMGYLFDMVNEIYGKELIRYKV